MKFFPYERFTIITSLTPAQVYQRLQREVKPSELFSLKDIFKDNSAHYFKGAAGPANFQIEPQIQGRNSFVPLIKGSIDTYLNGSRVSVTMSLKPVVFVFMCCWLGFVCIFAIGIGYNIVRKNQAISELLFPAGMFAFGYCLALFSFRSESVDARKKLVSMFEGEVEMIK